MAKWISVEDHLPKQEWTVVFVFWIGDKPYFGLGFYDDALRCFIKGTQLMDKLPVTHWLKLPKVPKTSVGIDLEPYIRTGYR